MTRQAATAKNKKKSRISEPPGPVKGSRSAQKEDTRERVRQAALELFSTVGFDQTTTKAVAERAGVASGTVFVHAADKADLLSLVMGRVLRDAVEKGFADAPDDDLKEQLLSVFGAIFAAYAKLPKLAEPFVRTLPNAKGPNSEQVQAFTFEFLNRIAGLVSAAQERGEIDENVPPLLLAQNAFALYFFALLSWISGYATAESVLCPHLDMALSLQLRGLVKAR